MTEATYDEPGCPLRPGSACALCFPGATGPWDCGLVYLVMSDPQLREQALRRAAPLAAGARAAAH